VEELHRTHVREMWRFAPRGQFSTARGLRPQRASVSCRENQPSEDFGKLSKPTFTDGEAEILFMGDRYT
jgi:hypothetical protein